MDILKISQFKHLKHETTSARVVIKLKWKKTKGKDIAVTLEEAQPSVNRLHVPFICSLLLIIS